MTNIFLFITFLLFFSCGKAPKESSTSPPEEEVENEGVYSGVFIPVNPRISSRVQGEVKISRYGDDFRVKVHLSGAPRGTFTQFLHTGSLCPRPSQDLNSDGYVDAFESSTVTNYAVVPLDGDLGSQPAGGDLLLQGNYRYNRSTSYYLMLADLHVPDETVNDGLVKLSERDLPIDRRVVVVYINRNSGLPSTVSGAKIPIACTLLTKVSNRPDPDEDTYDPPPRIPKPPQRKPPRRPPKPEPLPDPEPYTPSWWERLRDTWYRWTDRMSDWWNS